MLVRELIEQLSEMPPDVPVGVRLWGDSWVPLESASYAGRIFGPVGKLYVHLGIVDQLVQDRLEVYISHDN